MDIQNVKNYLNETKQNIKTEFKRIKRKRFKALPVILIITLLVLALLESGHEWSLQGAANRRSNAETQQTIDRLNGELNGLRNEVKQNRDQQNSTNQQLDNKIKAVEQSKAAEKQRILASQSPQSLASQRPVFVPSGDIEAEVARVFGANARVAWAIVMAESGGNPGATNGRDWGIFQVEASAHPQWSINELLDYRINIQAAYAISNGGTNWYPWSTYKSGKYLRYL